MVESESSKCKKKKDSSRSFENIQVVRQPGNISLGFVEAESGKAANIFKGLWSHLTKGYAQQLNNLFAIGSDGAANNVGVD